MSNNKASKNTNDDEITAYDLNGDGKVSLSESARAKVGIIDARLEQVERDGGVKGRIAGAARKVTDTIDND